MAAITGDLGVCQILVGAGADLEAYTSAKEKKTPLHFAVERLHVDIVKLLVEAGADVNAEAFMSPDERQYRLDYIIDDDHPWPDRPLSLLQLVIKFSLS